MSSDNSTVDNTKTIPPQPQPVTSSAMGITIPHVGLAKAQENDTSINSTNPTTSQSHDINNNNTLNNPNPVSSSAMGATVPPQQSSVVPEPAVRDQENFNPTRNGYDLIDDDTVASDPSKGPLGKRIIGGQPATEIDSTTTNANTNIDPAMTNTTNDVTSPNNIIDNSNTSADKKALGDSINPTTASSGVGIKDKIKGGIDKLAAKFRGENAREV